MNPSTQHIQQRLWDLLEPLVSAHGLELVEVEYLLQHQWTVRLMIDRANVTIIPGFGVAPGEGVGIDECAEISREVSALLDVEDVIPHTYQLEVSSPGVQRPLRKLQDFIKFCGCDVRVRSKNLIPATEPEGAFPSKNFAGKLQQVNVEMGWIEVMVDGRSYHIPVDQISKAHLDPDMDEWMALSMKLRKESHTA